MTLAGEITFARKSLPAGLSHEIEAAVKGIISGPGFSASSGIVFLTSEEAGFSRLPGVFEEGETISVPFKDIATFVPGESRLAFSFLRAGKVIGISCEKGSTGATDEWQDFALRVTLRLAGSPPPGASWPAFPNPPAPASIASSLEKALCDLEKAFPGQPGVVLWKAACRISLGDLPGAVSVLSGFPGSPTIAWVRLLTGAWFLSGRLLELETFLERLSPTLINPWTTRLSALCRLRERSFPAYPKTGSGETPLLVVEVSSTPPGVLFPSSLAVPADFAGLSDILETSRGLLVEAWDRLDRGNPGRAQELFDIFRRTGPPDPVQEIRLEVGIRLGSGQGEIAFDLLGKLLLGGFSGEPFGQEHHQDRNRILTAFCRLAIAFGKETTVAKLLSGISQKGLPAPLLLLGARVLLATGDSFHSGRFLKEARESPGLNGFQKLVSELLSAESALGGNDLRAVEDHLLPFSPESGNGRGPWPSGFLHFPGVSLREICAAIEMYFRLRRRLEAAKGEQPGTILSDGKNGPVAPPRIGELLQKVLTVASEANGRLFPGKLPVLVKRLRERFSRPFTIAIVGEFNSGKSTLLNSLLGSPLLPTGVKPTTRIPCLIREGPPGLILATDQEGRIFPIPQESLESVVSESGSPKAGMPTSEVSRLEIFHRGSGKSGDDLLARACFADTPGLNSRNRMHQEASEKFVSESDAVLWVSNACQFGKGTECHALRRLVGPHQRIFAILNRMDEIDPEEREPVRTAFREAFGGFSQETFCVSARNPDSFPKKCGIDELFARIREGWLDRQDEIRGEAIRGILREIAQEAELLMGALGAETGRLISELNRGIRRNEQDADPLPENDRQEECLRFWGSVFPRNISPNQALTEVFSRDAANLLKPGFCGGFQISMDSLLEDVAKFLGAIERSPLFAPGDASRAYSWIFARLFRGSSEEGGQGFADRGLDGLNFKNGVPDIVDLIRKAFEKSDREIHSLVRSLRAEIGDFLEFFIRAREGFLRNPLGVIRELSDPEKLP